MLHLVPVTYRQAREFLSTRCLSLRFLAIGAWFAWDTADRDGRFVGIAFAVGPTGCLDDSRSLCLNRLRGDGTPNAATGLGMPVPRCAEELGYGHVLASTVGDGPAGSEMRDMIGRRTLRSFHDAGGASRFSPFRYILKATGGGRPRVAGVSIPAVEPVELMRWIVRLVTAFGGGVLAQFVGSGSAPATCREVAVSCVAVDRVDRHSAACLPDGSVTTHLGPCRPGTRQ